MHKIILDQRREYSHFRVRDFDSARSHPNKERLLSHCPHKPNFLKIRPGSFHAAPSNSGSCHTTQMVIFVLKMFVLQTPDSRSRAAREIRGFDSCRHRRLQNRDAWLCGCSPTWIGCATWLKHYPPNGRFRTSELSYSRFQSLNFETAKKLGIVGNTSKRPLDFCILLGWGASSIAGRSEVLPRLQERKLYMLP